MSGGYFNSGKTTAESTDSGFYLGNDGGTPKFHIGDNAKSLFWNGSNLVVNGNIINTGNMFSGAVSGRITTNSSYIQDSISPGNYASSINYGGSTTSISMTVIGGGYIVYSAIVSYFTWYNSSLANNLQTNLTAYIETTGGTLYPTSFVWNTMPTYIVGTSNNVVQRFYYCVFQAPAGLITVYPTFKVSSVNGSSLANAISDGMVQWTHSIQENKV